MSLYQLLLKHNVPMSNHQSDLYVKMTPASVGILSGYEFLSSVKRFTNQQDKTPWFDVPFAYDPFWKKVSMFAVDKQPESATVKEQSREIHK